MERMFDISTVAIMECDRCQRETEAQHLDCDSCYETAPETKTALERCDHFACRRCGEEL